MEDTDAGGVMYHSNYLNFTERARTEFGDELGINHAEMIQKHGLLFLVANLNIRYRKPLRMLETVTIETILRDVSQKRFTVEQNMILNDQKCAILRVELSCASIRGGSKAMPDEYLELFNKFLIKDEELSATG